MKLERNVGKTDMLVRLILAAVCIGLAFFAKIWWLYIFGGLFLLTSRFKFCPLYKLFKFSTHKD